MRLNVTLFGCKRVVKEPIPQFLKDMVPQVLADQKTYDDSLWSKFKKWIAYIHNVD